ncbi:MAG: DinB family protein [Bacteroidetes bacterium]|nr:MAG: DinB family protein [Bacteroidota bacterium]
MVKSIYHSELIMGLNNRLFINALAGVTEEQAKERLSDHNNPLVWIAAHTLSSRYFILVFLGKPATNPFRELFDNFRAYDPSLKYPTLEEIRKEWQNVTALLHEALKSVTEKQLSEKAMIQSPVADEANEGLLAFLAQHESYEIGQMAFLKKYFTREAMSYS